MPRIRRPISARRTAWCARPWACICAAPSMPRSVRHPRLVEPAMQILRRRQALRAAGQGERKEAFGGDIWQWHYDFATHHREDGVPKPLALNLHIFLDEVSEFNGPLWFVRGSHRHGPVPAALDTVTTSYPLWVVDNGTVAAPDPRGRHRFRQGPAGHGADLRRQPGAWLAGQHVALAAAHLLADPESGRECPDQAQSPRLSASPRPDAGDAAGR